jgi:outer membrane beta-barrel protein
MMGISTMGLRTLLILGSLSICTSSFASNMIDLPEEELARESVTPVFDKNPSTKNRSVVTEGKVDMNLFYGTALTEPIANVSKFGLSGYYHTSENAAWGLMLNKNSSGLSTYAAQLKETYNLDFTKAPAPDMTAMLDYNHMAFYGKMSITKKTVLNLHLFGSLAGGIVKYVHKSYPAIALGVGEKFYFSRNWAFRFDFRVFMHQAPIPFLKDKLKSSSSGYPPSYDDFSERLTTTSVLDLGISYLF